MVDILEVTRNWQRDGRWKEIEPLRDAMMKEARRSGLSREDAREEVYSALLEKYPQTQPAENQQTEGQQSEAGGVVDLTAATAETTTPAVSTHTRDESAVTGLDAIPEHWPALPSNAPLAVEIQWVQANRLSVVRDLGDRTLVDLGKAMTPAPSWSAIGWLETSIRAYAKFVDVAAKASATIEDEREMVRRERLAIDEIRGLLAEMLAE